MPSTINVLFVHPTVYLNGVSRSLADLINRLDRRRFNVFVAVPPQSALEGLITAKDVTFERVEMTNLSRRPMRALRHFLALPFESASLRRFAERVRADVVYGNTIFASWALRASRSLRLPCVIHVHEGPRSFPPFLYRRWVHQAGRQAALILAVSKEIAGVFDSQPSQVVCVGNGIDLERFESIQPRNRTPQQKGTAFRILCVSHLMEGKGQHELIRQLPAIAEKCPGVAVTMVGGTNGIRRNEEYLESLRSLATGLGVSERVNFVGPKFDLAEAFSACDTFVNTSPYETFGLTIIEALAAGVPVISRRVGIVDEISRQGVPGLFVVEKSWGELAGLLGSIDGNGYVDYRVARAPYLEPFRIDLLVETISSLLERVVATQAHLP